MAMQKEYQEDTIIITEKGVSRQMYMVLSGSVALYVNYGKDGEYLLGLCNKGTVFGEMGVLCHAPSTYTAVAVTEVIVAVFSEFELGYFIKTYPEKAIGIMRSTARLNSVLSLNLKMMIEDSQSEKQLLNMLSDAMKDDEEVEGDSKNEKWRFLKEPTE